MNLGRFTFDCTADLLVLSRAISPNFSSGDNTSRALSSSGMRRPPLKRDYSADRAATPLSYRMEAEYENKNKFSDFDESFNLTHSKLPNLSDILNAQPK